MAAAFRSTGGEATVDTRSYQIRESNRGKAPYNDLLPEGNDHGILWRLNSYWRLRQMGTSVYAEFARDFALPKTAGRGREIW